MSTLVIDSSVYVSYFGKDTNTPVTKRFWQSFKTKTSQIIVPSLVVAETLVSLSKQGVPYLELVSKYFNSSTPQHLLLGTNAC